MKIGLLLVFILMNINILNSQDLDTIVVGLKQIERIQLKVNKINRIKLKEAIADIVFYDNSNIYLYAEGVFFQYDSTMQEKRVLYKEEKPYKIIFIPGYFIILSEKEISSIRFNDLQIVNQVSHIHDEKTRYSPVRLIRNINENKFYVTVFESGFDVEYKIKEFENENLKQGKTVFVKSTEFGMFDMFSPKDKLLKKAKDVLAMAGRGISLNKETLLITNDTSAAFYLVNINRSRIEGITKLIKDKKSTNPNNKIKIYDLFNSKFGNFILLNDNNLLWLNNKGVVLKTILIDSGENITSFFVDDYGNFIFYGNGFFYRAKL